MTATVRPSMPVPRGVFLALTVFMCGVVVAGFWPYVRAAGRTPPRPWLIHVHAAVFAGWMVLLLAQVLLVLRRRTDVHRRVGRFGMGYGVLVLLLGIAVTIVVPALHLARSESSLEESAAFLLILIGDMTLFGSLFTAGMIFRRQPDVHKRCMLLATVALTFAPVARLVDAPVLIVGLWLTPVVLAAGVDWRTHGRVHRTYVIGVAVLLVGVSRVFFMHSPAWQRIGRPMVELFRPRVESLF